MASSGHPQYGTQQAILPGSVSVPQGYYASQQPMMYSYEDMQLLQQRLPMSTQLQQAQLSAAGANAAHLGSPFVVPQDAAKYSTAITNASITQQQQMAAAAAAGGVYMPGNPGVHPYLMYQYAPTMMPGVPAQYGASPHLLQYANMPVASHSVPPQYQMPTKMLYGSPTHPYYESLPQEYKAGAYAHTTHAQSKIVAPRVSVNAAADIATGIKSQAGKTSSATYNSAGVTPSPYAPMIIPSLPPGTAPPNLMQHQMKPKY